MPADTPPASRARARANARAGKRDEPPRPAAQAAPTPRKGTLENKLQEFFSVFALAFSAMGDEHCAGVITMGTPNLARSWSKLADESPAVKRVLERLMTGGAWGGVVVSTLAIAIPIADHHNLVPSGFVNPFALSAEPINTNANGNGSSPPARDPFRPSSPPPTATA